MRWLFVRVYLAMAVVLAAGAVVTWWLAQPNQRALQGATPDFFVEAPREVADALADAPDAEAALARLRASGRDVRFAELHGSPDLLPAGAAERLAQGQAVAALPVAGRPGVVIPVPGLEDRAVVVRDAAPAAAMAPPGVLAALGLLGLMVAAVPLLLRPLDRELAKLQAASEALGRGDLEVAVPVAAGAATAGVSAAFNHMAGQVKQVLAAREELLRAVSHELRTPLTRVRFGVTLLEEAADPDERVRLADGLQRDMDELDELVAELLTWTRAEAGALTPAAVDVVAVAQGLVHDLQRGPDGVDATVVGQCAAWQADERLLVRALRNLLSNAARYGQGQVQVHLSDTAVVVHDDGPGIPAAARADVFEPFVRLDSTRDRDTGGSGLGLALVARVCAAHGWVPEVGDSPLGGAAVGWRVSADPASIQGNSSAASS